MNLNSIILRRKSKGLVPAMSGNDTPTSEASHARKLAVLGIFSLNLSRLDSLTGSHPKLNS